MIRADEFHTPRSVWATSAIAAVLLHGLLLWWGLATWQGRRANVVEPTPIRLVTLSDDAPAGSPATASNPENAAAPLAASTPTQPANSAVADASRPAPTKTSAPAPRDRRLAPVPPTNRPPAQTLSPSPTNPVSPAPSIAPAPAPPVSPPPPPQTGSPTAPPAVADPSPAPSPPPVSAPPAGSPEGAPPAAPPPPNPPAPGGGSTAPPDNSGAPAASSGVQSWWSLQPVPGGGSDIHDQIPQMPSGWQAATARLLTEAGCAADAIAPGTSVRLTLWPAVDAQGHIFEFLPWEGDRGAPPAVQQCVTALRSQLPPLLPAQDGGQPIASDEVLLVIELRGTP